MGNEVVVFLQPEMHGKIDACIVYCSEPKPAQALSDLLTKKNVRRYVGLSFPGGALALVPPGGSVPIGEAIEHVALTIRLFKPPRIIFTSHSNCSDYHDAGAGGEDIGLEFPRHVILLEEARANFKAAIEHLKDHEYVFNKDVVINAVFLDSTGKFIDV